MPMMMNMSEPVGAAFQQSRQMRLPVEKVGRRVLGAGIAVVRREKGDEHARAVEIARGDIDRL